MRQGLLHSGRWPASRVRRLTKAAMGFEGGLAIAGGREPARGLSCSGWGRPATQIRLGLDSPHRLRPS